MRTTKTTTNKTTKEKGPCRSCKKKKEIDINDLPDLIVEDPKFEIDVTVIEDLLPNEEQTVIQDLSDVYIPNHNEIKYLYEQVNKGVKEDDRERISKIYYGVFVEPFEFTSDTEINKKQYNKIRTLAEDLKLVNYSEQDLKTAYLQITNPLGIKKSEREFINKIYKHLFDEEFDFDCRNCINVQARKFKNYLVKHNIKRI